MDENGKVIDCEVIDLPHGFHPTITEDAVVIRCIYCGRERDSR